MTLGIPEWTKANHNDLAAIAHRIQIGIYRTRPSDYSGSHRNLRYRWAQDCAGSSAVEPSNAMRILIEPFVVKSCKGILFSQTAMVFPVFLGRSNRSGYRRSAWKTEWVIYCHCGIVVGCGGWGSLPPCLFVWSEQCLAKLTFPGTLHLMPMVTKVTEMSLSWYLTLELHVQYYMGWLLLR
jgi:hypothetical protein